MRDERWETRDERQETRDERRETGDERWETSGLENKSAGDYISKPPGPKWKICGLHRKERYSMYLTLPRGSLLHTLPLNSKSPGKTDTFLKICMILVSAVCRPAGHNKYFASTICLIHTNPLMPNIIPLDKVQVNLNQFLVILHKNVLQI